MSNSNESMGLAYQAAYRAVGLVGHEAAAQRYRNAVDAALEVLKPAIAAEALRMAATVMVAQGEGRERVHEVARLAYYAVRLGSAGRLERLGAAINAAWPLIAADALRTAASEEANPLITAAQLRLCALLESSGARWRHEDHAH